MILKYPSSANLNWTKEYLIQVLTGGSKPVITDPQIVNAFLRIDRKDFVPDNLKYLAYNDVSLDLGNDVKLEKPTTMAQILSYLKPKFGGSYLIIGAGSGYAPALLGLIAGEAGKVFALEKSNWILELAKNNLGKYSQIRNIELSIRDLTKGYIEKSPFDGIYISYPTSDLSEVLKNQLKIGSGTMIMTTESYNLNVIERKTNEEFIEEMIDELAI